MSATLCQPPTLEEMRLVVFNMDATSTAGPDGFNAFFYQKCWEIIKDDVLEVVEDFMNGSPILVNSTATSIVLIPKVKNLTTWSDFRPISLCNTTNKILTKLMNERLKMWLPDLISPNRSGFVSNRQIGHNILLAQEILQSIGKHKTDCNVLLKLDMAKAYDCVHWSFLHEVLSRFGFSTKWVNLVLNCVTNCWFSLLINGELCGFFHSTRGIRQGDPLSPSLFVLLAEYMSKGLNKLMAEQKNLAYRGSLGVSHLAYADDVIVFTNNRDESLETIMDFLQYCKGSCPASAKSYQNSSNVWKRRLDEVEKEIRWSLGTGEICFQHDIWMGEISLYELVNPSFSHHERVNYYWTNGEWDVGKLRLVLPPNIVSQITRIPFDEHVCDRAWWKLDTKGAFSIKSAWQELRAQALQRQSLADLWNNCLRPTISIFMWRLLPNLLPVDERMQDKGIILASKCLCCNENETLQHLFLKSNTTVVVWRHFGSLFAVALPEVEFASTMLQYWKLSSPFFCKGHVRSLIPVLVLWFIWNMRNQAKHNDVIFRPNTVIRNVYNYLWRLYQAGALRAVHWKGDRDIVARLGFHYQRMPQPQPLIVRWTQSDFG
ncbi:UNVERIFIED_CONTAM: hypothetical protein Slati_1472100 [Sesamum latifolium]|uniref:Reverse transcriptase domain-containing protein n=1 Tax=Sesamum latifolium TaxID=2727402 RepID=A0AAW2X4N0_9LAMI